MVERSLPEPRFENARGAFSVTLYHKAESSAPSPAKPQRIPVARNHADPKGLLAYCLVPRTRAEIVAYFAIDSGQYALKRYLEPLIQSGAIELTMPENPRSSKQQFVTASAAR